MLIEGPQGAPGPAVSITFSHTLLSAFHRWRTAKEGKNVFMERVSALIASKAWVGRDSQNVYLCMNVCMSVCEGEIRGVWGYFILRHFFQTLLSLLACACEGLDRLTVVGMLVSSSLRIICWSACASGFRVFLVPQDYKVPQVPQEILVRGWVKAGRIFFFTAMRSSVSIFLLITNVRIYYNVLKHVCAEQLRFHIIKAIIESSFHLALCHSCMIMWLSIYIAHRLLLHWIAVKYSPNAMEWIMQLEAACYCSSGRD